VEGVVNTFIANYNRSWRVERLGFKTPIEARTSHLNLEPQTTAA